MENNTEFNLEIPIVTISLSAEEALTLLKLIDAEVDRWQKAISDEEPESPKRKELEREFKTTIVPMAAKAALSVFS